MSCDLYLCGWRVRSELPLHELLPWQGNDCPVDIEIRVAAIPETQEAPVFALPHSRLWANGDFLLDMDGVGRFWVEGGRRVLVEPVSRYMDGEFKAFLLGSVLGVLCHQRGLLPIHAAAVRVGSSAVLICGNSGDGKSTLAAALGARGHALATDDVAAIDPGGPLLLPSYPQRKLTPDVLNTLSIPHEGLVTHRPGQVKYRVPSRADFYPTPIKPAAVYVLNVSSVGPFGEPESLPPAKAMAALNTMIYRRAIGMKIQSNEALFSSIAKLAQAAPVYTLRRRKGAPLEDLDSFARTVEMHALRNTR